MAMIGLILAWIAAAALGLQWWRNSILEGDEERGRNTPQRPAARSLNPRQLGDQAAAQLWILRSDPSCTHSAKLNGRRVRGDQAIPLFNLGCRPGQCDCHYQRTSEARRRLRRVNTDRREELRFSNSSERRDSDDRRGDARAWSASYRAH